MDNSFISKDNIENIYEYINAHFVKKHNYNLNSYDNYRKIIKKLSKTIFNSIKDNEVYQNILINDFNEIVLKNSTDFLLNDIKTKRTPQNIDVKSSNSGLIESTLLENNLAFDIDEHKQTKKKSNKRRKKKSNPEPLNPQSSNISSSLNNKTITINNNEEFLNDFDNFNTHLKVANKKIKDNFKQIINSGDNNFMPISLPNNSDKCKEEQISLNSNKLAFEKILEEKLEENNLSDPTTSAYDSYTNSDVSDMLTSVIFKQKDNSTSNQLDSYEGEEYLPNIIKPFGEQAPIQPLIYQNTGQGTERIDKKIITIDSGTGDTNGVLSLDTVTNNGSTNDFYWHKFRVDLQDTVRIDKLCDVYLRSITIKGVSANTTCQYFVIDIEEFNIRNYSNNTNLRNKITVANTSSTGSATTVLNINYGSEDNYITTINPEKLNNLNITITNQDNESVEDGDNKTFADSDSDSTNRIIFELEFRSRGERDEMIFETHSYSGSV
jgi:hypothetical protein